jgi:hypothetical protein
LQAKQQVNTQTTEDDGEHSARRLGVVQDLSVGGHPPYDITDHQRAVALTWVSRGLPVIPCSRTTKGALVPGFGRSASPGELHRFADPEQVRSWWSGRYRRAHVGVLTGRGLGALVVVDLDMSKLGAPPLTGRWEGCQHGTDVLERLAAEHGAPWPDTYTVVTPSGGLHLYFRAPRGEPIGCATGDGGAPPHLGPLVDVRGIGGYVIAAGSYSRAQGRAYTRVSGPELLPQPLPAWLLALLRPTSPPSPTRTPTPLRALPTGTRAERYAAVALNGAVEDVANAPEGERNRRLRAAARHLGEIAHLAPSVITETTVQQQLLPAALAAGLPERPSLASIRSGWDKGLATPSTPRALGGAA